MGLHGAAWSGLGARARGIIVCLRPIVSRRPRAGWAAPAARRDRRAKLGKRLEGGRRCQWDSMEFSWQQASFAAGVAGGPAARGASRAL